MSDSITLERLRQAWNAQRSEQRGGSAEDPDDERFLAETHRSLIAPEDERDPAVFPVLGNLSAAFFFRFLPIPDQRTDPEFVYVPSTMHRAIRDGPKVEDAVAVTEWNVAWEAAQLRHELFAEKLSPRLQWLEKYRGENIFLLPRSERHQYFAHAVLFHMIPRRILERHCLPPLQRGLWPHYIEDFWTDAVLPNDFDQRLSRAFADLIWNRIDSSSGYAAFSKTDPIRLLAHNLDFWLPYAHEVVEHRLRSMPRTEIESEEQARLLDDGRRYVPPGIQLDRPRKGTILWQGEQEALEAVDELLTFSDSLGRLRGIVDAVRSNRVEEDFSDRWSFAREDFERRLYRKRAKVSVKFVELDATVPVHGPDSEVHESILWEDFMGLLNAKERAITILLRSGVTRVGDIAQHMGYAGHSPVSKALARIRQKALRYLS